MLNGTKSTSLGRRGRKAGEGRRGPTMLLKVVEIQNTLRDNCDNHRPRRIARTANNHREHLLGGGKRRGEGARDAFAWWWWWWWWWRRVVASNVVALSGGGPSTRDTGSSGAGEKNKTTRHWSQHSVEQRMEDSGIGEAPGTMQRCSRLLASGGWLRRRWKK